MSNIIDVKKEAVKFLKDNISCYDVTVIKIEKVNKNWSLVAEVYEDDSFLKSMNLPAKQVRLYYSLKMNEKMDIVSFERLNGFDGSDS